MHDTSRSGRSGATPPATPTRRHLLIAGLAASAMASPVPARARAECPDGSAGGSQAREVPPPWDIAVPLVRNLYRSYAVAGPQVLRDIGWLRAYFFTDVAKQIIQGVDGDPLYGGQDSDVSELRVAFDPDVPVMQGMVTVVARFRNFGTEQRATLSLRGDPVQGGAIRIFRIEHQDGSVVP